MSGLLVQRNSLVLMLFAIGVDSYTTSGVYVPKPFPRSGAAPGIAHNALPNLAT